jgi:hypothetical protein
MRFSGGSAIGVGPFAEVVSLVFGNMWIRVIAHPLSRRRGMTGGWLPGTEVESPAMQPRWDRVPSYDAPRLQRAARAYGNVKTRKFFAQALGQDGPNA